MQPCTERNGDRGEVFTLAPGVELLGADRSGGFQQQRYLVRRGDGQIAQLPQVLYLVAEATDGHRDHDAIAGSVQQTLGREVNGEQIDYLLRNQLLPAGILTDQAPEDAASHGAIPTGDGRIGAAPPSDQPARADHLLTLRHRRAVIRDTTVWTIAGMFRWLYHPVAVILGLAAFLLVDGQLLTELGVAEFRTGAEHLLVRPLWALVAIGIVILAGIFHECGHVTACRYSGATPGAMGVGLYLVWPAFYSNVTDAYRLGRGGRLRTDLGGVYFNALALASLGAGYLVTEWPWLLAALVVLHLDTAWQFLPSLRFDGYYILADLVGVPDLFNRIGPILTSLLPTRATSVRVAELKPWVRRIVSAWVALVIPFLAGALALLVTTLARLLPTAGASLLRLLTQSQHALFTGRVALGIVTLGQAAMLLLPMVGGTIVLVNLTKRLVRTATQPLLRGRYARLVRAARSPTTGQLALVGGAGVLLLRIGAATNGDIGVLTAVAVMLTSLVTVVALLRLSAALPLLTLAVAATSTSQLAGLLELTGPALPVAAGQAVTLAALTLPVRFERLWPLVRTLPPFAIGLGLTTTPLVSLVTALLAFPTVTRTRLRMSRAGGPAGRHRRADNPQTTRRPVPNRAATEQKGPAF